MIRSIVFAVVLLISTTAVVALGSKPGAVMPALGSNASPEAWLVRIYAEIESARLDAASELTESLLRQYPNFRLGYLIKGDLLMARVRPIATFGNAANAPMDRLADLREEAVVRLKSYRQKPSAGVVPSYLLQMRPDQKYAVVVDTHSARLYLYENDKGQPRFVADYYVSHGKLGAEKVREGDKKTPVGVYHITSSLPQEKLADLYGSGAFPINYPNEWDKRHGRNGHGIWLHGTPSDTFSRPPKASDGCIVLSNQDLDALGKKFEPGVTPVIISNGVEWLPLGEWQAERAELGKRLDEWRSDWESRDMDRFLRHYSKKFQADNQSLQEFGQQKRQVNAGKDWIKIQVSNVSMFRNPGKEDMIVVSFDQNYSSSNLSNQMKKRQYWIREDGAWKIVYEGVA